MTERPCGKDCPRRKPGCQNEETCEKWKEHMIRVRADRAERKKRVGAAADYREVRRIKQKRFSERGR